MDQRFIEHYQILLKAINDLNQKKITPEHAKALASLSKQANNVTAMQLDTAKLISKVPKEIETILKSVGLIQPQDNGTEDTL